MWLNCCGNQPNPLRGATPLDIRRFNEPDMDARVDRHWLDHKVRKIDYCLNGLLTVVGMAMIAFSIAMILLTHSSFGWTLQLVPFYILYGGVGVLGCGLTLLSIKWMIHSCKQSNEFDRWAKQ
jgi:hypothetical protein